MKNRKLFLCIFFLTISLSVSKNSICVELSLSKGAIIYRKNDELIRKDTSLIYDKKNNRYVLAWAEGKPKNMKIFVSVSKDGKRWTKPTVVYDNGENVEPCLFQSMDGMYRLVWSHRSVVENQYASSADLFYSVSADLKEWTAPAPFDFNSDLVDEQMPCLSQDTDGIYKLLWSASDLAKTKTEIYYSTSTYFVDWTKPQKIQTGFVHSYYPRWIPSSLVQNQIIFVADSDLFLRFIDDTAANLFRIVKISGKKSIPQIAGDRKNGYLLVFQTPARVHYSYLGEDKFFSEPKEIQVNSIRRGRFLKRSVNPENVIIAYPSVAVGKDGNFCICFAMKINKNWSLVLLKQKFNRK